MSAPARFLIYMVALFLALAGGRYLLPSPGGSLADQEGRKKLRAEALADYWREKLAAIGLEPAPVRLGSFVRILGGAVPGDLPAIFDIVREDESLGPVLAAHWAESNPKEFYRFLTVKKMSTRRDFCMAGILLHHWATQDFESAKSAALGLRSGGVALDTMRPVLMAVAATDARKAVEVLKEGNVSVPAAELASLMQPEVLEAKAWGGLGLADRLKLVSRLPESPAKSELASRIIRALAKSNPEAAAAYMANSEPGVMLTVAEAWCGADAEAAMQAFNQEKDGLVRLMLGRGIARALADTDPQAAWEWAQGALSGKAKTEAWTLIAVEEARRNPAAALQRLMDLPDAAWRRQAIISVADAWFTEAEKEFNSWLATISSTPEHRIIVNALLKPKKENE